jgi:hypothetical protein
MVVESGCPNLLRKAVNSGKRLRAYVLLDEGNVCYHLIYNIYSSEKGNDYTVLKGAYYLFPLFVMLERPFHC